MDRYIRCPENGRTVRLQMDSRPGVADVCDCPNYNGVTMMCDKLMPEEMQNFTHLADFVTFVLRKKLANEVTRQVEGQAICHFRRDEFKRSLIMELVRELEVPAPPSPTSRPRTSW